MEDAIQLFTAAAAFVAAAASVWSACRFSLLEGKVDTLETAHDAHVNAAGLHGR